MTDETYPAAGTNSRSHLGAGSRITGELSFPGTVELPGYVKGRVDASAIVIEQAGEVDGELHAASVAIKGRFQGQIIGGKVALHASARVTGDVTYESLSIETGAQVEGVCRRRPYSGGAKPVDQARGSSVE
ncbi:Polymer-forming cytoskeletal [Roseovarius gaetbuli]|uniref:Polymer-forming cytoskeletal n=1 Tax=Roseovarius gaetbuli TaxID=1356575 RepID=A0A1X6ZUC0_9RHOB|nr:polymer-forming cytoskeletal protein [Roseovarius gaetbuli]SLN61740.1 Polymer-forming cytoskeletal [Roseovarius gaetbuli]